MVKNARSIKLVNDIGIYDYSDPNLNNTFQKNQFWKHIFDQTLHFGLTKLFEILILAF